MIRRIFNPPTLPDSANWGVLVLRLGMSILLMVYGYGKLEQYMSGDRGFADPIGIGEETTLLIAILAEFVCPILVILGLWTRAALIPIMLTMLIAFFIIHSADAWDQREHPLVFLIPFVALWLTGPGRFSLDQRIFGR